MELPPRFGDETDDNLGFGELSCYGGGPLLAGGVKTSRIDAFGREGEAFAP